MSTKAPVLVTGATSFIGLKLCSRLVREQNSVVAVCRPDSARLGLLEQNPLVRTVYADMSDYSQLDSMVGEACSTLFALAWNGTRGHSRDDDALQASNLEHSLDALRCALNLGCTTIISAGSQAEYGLHAGPVSEQTICKPVTAYGKNKLKFFERALELCPADVAFREPRFFSLYGKEDSQQTMLISILSKMLRNLPCQLTLCVQSWDFLHIDDAIEGLLALMQADCQSGAYNFGSGQAQSLRAFIEQMLTLSGSSSQLEFGAVDFPSSGMVNVNPSIDKMRKQCAWSPKISFEEGISDIIVHLKRSLA